MDNLTERLNKEAAFGKPDGHKKYQQILKEYKEELSKQLHEYAYFNLIPHITTVNPKGEDDSWCPDLNNFDSYDKHHGTLDLAIHEIKNTESEYDDSVAKMLSYSLGCPYVFAGQRKDGRFICMHDGLYITEAIGTFIKAEKSINKPNVKTISLNDLIGNIVND